MTRTEYEYLLCIHLIVSDFEIHSQELEFLMANSFDLSDGCKVEATKIMSDDDDKIELSVITDHLQKETNKYKIELIEILIQLSIIDGFFHKKEQEFITAIAIQLQLSLEEVNQLIVKYENEITVNYIDKKQSLYASLKERLFKQIHDFSNNDYFEQNLLEGNTFVQKIKEIAGRASNDLELASDKMLLLNTVLESNFKEIERYSNKIRSVNGNYEKKPLLEFIDKLNNETKDKILSAIKKNTQVLDKKKHTVDYFSIAFLGRTKAGKSTFHKVITGEQTDDVGVGKLRTTRYNRVFNWENIRIIDTPGIGAPGGKEDTEIARSIIDEADLICYVITSDAIQETEFNFLTELKDQNKSIFIILNYKENLEHPTRLERFLKNPKAWLENKKEKSLDGHMERINEMVSKYNYDPSLIEIVPIYLLAAKMAKEEHYNYINKALIDGSNINTYNKLIKQTIFRNGNLKKTQNIIDGCNFHANAIYTKTGGDLRELNNFLIEITKEKKNLLKFFDDNQRKTNSSINAAIKSTHGKICGDLKMFAANEFENKGIGEAWEKFMQDNDYYNSLSLNLKNVILDFQKKVEDRLKESLEDIAINLTKIDIPSLKLNVVNSKFIANITYGVANVALATFALANIWNPVGWTLAAVTAVSVSVGFLINIIFDSKDKKIKKAIDKIVDTIQPKIIENEQQIFKNVNTEFLKSTQLIRENLVTSFDEMIDGTENIVNILNTINVNSKEYSDYFNKILFFRSLEQMDKIKINEPLSEQDIKKYLSNTSIERSGENIKVKTTYKLTKQELSQLNKALQLNISLN